MQSVYDAVFCCDRSCVQKGWLCGIDFTYAHVVADVQCSWLDVLQSLRRLVSLFLVQILFKLYVNAIVNGNEYTK